MGLVKKEEMLAMPFRVTRELHDEVDAVRKLAKSVGASYDPSEALHKALKKDLAATRAQIEKLKAKTSSAE